MRRDGWRIALACAAAAERRGGCGRVAEAGEVRAALLPRSSSPARAQLFAWPLPLTLTRTPCLLSSCTRAAYADGCPLHVHCICMWLRGLGLSFTMAILHYGHPSLWLYSYYGHTYYEGGCAASGCPCARRSCASTPCPSGATGCGCVTSSRRSSGALQARAACMCCMYALRVHRNAPRTAAHRSAPRTAAHRAPQHTTPHGAPAARPLHG